MHRVEKVPHNEPDSCGISCIEDIIFRVVRKAHRAVVSITKEWSPTGKFHFSLSVPPICLVLLTSGLRNIKSSRNYHPPVNCIKGRVVHQKHSVSRCIESNCDVNTMCYNWFPRSFRLGWNSLGERVPSIMTHVS